MLCDADVQAYVLSGLDIPTTYDLFDVKISRWPFQKLSGFDPEIHDVRERKDNS
jgi:hypothetical protein